MIVHNRAIVSSFRSSPPKAFDRNTFPGGLSDTLDRVEMGGLPQSESMSRTSLSSERAFNLEALLAQIQDDARRLESSLAPHRSNQVLLKLPFENEFSGSDTEQLFSDFRFTSGREIKMPAGMAERIGGRFYLATLDNFMSVSEAVTALHADGRILNAEPNYLVSRDQIVLDGATNDSQEEEYKPPVGAPIDLRPTQWNLYNEGQTGGVAGVDVSAMEAWQISKGSGVTIALLDTGVDLNNPDLKPNLWVNQHEIPGDGIDNDGNGYIDDVHGINLVDRAKQPIDDNGHGTYNASVIGAVEGNDANGLVGLAPESKMISIKFMEASGRGDIAAAIEGISYAEQQGARIVVNGWMSRTQNQSLFEAIKASTALHVCSAGNDGYDNDSRPAHPASFPLPNVVSVAASDHHDDFTRFTNKGSHSVDLAAPGRKVPVYEQKGKIELQGGASVAAAHVAGAAALIVSKYPDIPNEALATRLIYNGDPMPAERDRTVSGRRLNAAAALREDPVAPATPGGFEVTALDGSNIKVSFQTVSDDGGISKEPVAFYEARISSRPIVPDDQVEEGAIGFSQASPLELELGQDMVPDRDVSSVIAVGPSGKDRHFYLAIRATDKVGNHSELSQASVVVPKSRVLFEDGFEVAEGTPDGWTFEGEWAREEFAGRGTIVTDSPDGDYKNNVDASLTSPVIDLKGIKNAVLSFDARYTIEPKHDGCLVEIESDGWWGKKWKTLTKLDGFSEWKNQRVDISEYAGKDVRIRFRMKTDRDRVAYGIQLDHMTVSTSDPAETPANV